MTATPEQLKELAHLKYKLRQTNVEAASYFGVSSRTIIRWTQQTEFGRFKDELRAELETDARLQVSSIVDDVIDALHMILLNGKSEMARVQAAKILGEWVGLHNPTRQIEVDDRDEAVKLIKELAARPIQVIGLPPPKAGGALPDFVEGVVIEERKELPVERERERDGEPQGIGVLKEEGERSPSSGRD